jgi:hypothetical protein
MGPNVTITQRGPGAQQVRNSLDAIMKMEVLVGIPQAKTIRPKDKINNSSLLYIHTHGSPMRNIPARPVIEPAIEADGNKQAIAAELKQAVKAQFDGEPQQAKQFMRRAGTAGSNAAKAWFTDARNNWAPNSPETIRRKGSSRPLIDTSALRRSITFVVRDI